ncbi:hypothetical protein [Hymenobacter latericus]|uniref:hypothetical protein n=1 Tax=Hymenobacter sp. YIM 151858-1 TaxID=2987688 RepID=UPI0022263E78|nr:hypothetical protein [Hymenobacter sp. YIM 151858-1]UYZ60062.1 hypothetical protein OIS50_04500 [Hymenobacter sp. YIM 151858-1]
MSKAVTKLTGPMAGQEAEKKARYGRKDWVVYTTREGVRTAEVLTLESLKRAMLAHGTNKPFTHIVGGLGSRMYTTWRIAVNLFYQLKYPNEYRKGPALYANKRSELY